MNIYLTSAWENQDQVRALAEHLRCHRHGVHDATDSRRHATPSGRPGRGGEPSDPVLRNYGRYLQQGAWYASAGEDWRALHRADLVILILPSDMDATAAWAIGVGLGRHTLLVGHLPTTERSLVHLWANAFLPTINEVLPYLNGWSVRGLVENRPMPREGPIDAQQDTAETASACGTAR